MTKTGAILTIGDELLRGELVDSNASWLAGRLGELGVQLVRLLTVGDALEEVTQGVRDAAAGADVVLITGGLGPTEDDRTGEAVARAAGVGRVLHEEILTRLEQRFARAGYACSPNNAKQAWLPAGATVLPNERGTAPGFSLQLGQARLFCMPGVPAEMKAMFHAQVAPALAGVLGVEPALVRVVRTFGLGESQIDHQLADVLAGLAAGPARVTLHYRASFPEVQVSFVVRPEAGQGEAGRALLDEAERRVRDRLGPAVYGVGDTSFSAALIAALQRHGASIAAAESCTGGLVGDMITREPGASSIFDLGVVAYSNEFKQRLLGVPEQVLRRHGAVSKECVVAMARGVRELAGATYGVATSGIAGPTGGTPDKPVGTVHFAMATEGDVWHLERLFPFERQQVKIISAYVALLLPLRHLNGTLTREPLQGRWSVRSSDDG